jgi:hypothetical protein
MALYAYLRAHPNATRAELEDAMDGNLCRCTGYRPILDAIKSVLTLSRSFFFSLSFSFFSSLSLFFLSFSLSLSLSLSLSCKLQLLLD